MKISKVIRIVLRTFGILLFIQTILFVWVYLGFNLPFFALRGTVPFEVLPAILKIRIGLRISVFALVSLSMIFATDKVMALLGLDKIEYQHKTAHTQAGKEALVKLALVITGIFLILQGMGIVEFKVNADSIKYSVKHVGIIKLIGGVLLLYYRNAITRKLTSKSREGRLSDYPDSN